MHPLLTTDYHIHTVYSGHSGMDMLVGNILRAAKKRGLRSVAIVEHTPPIDPRIREEVCSGRFHPGQCVRAHLDAILDERSLWHKHPRVKMLAGAEIDADPLTLDGGLLLENRSGLDIILASTHFLPRGRGMWFDRTPWPQQDREEMYQEWFSWAMHIAANPDVHVLAHPCASLCAIGAIESFEGQVLDDLGKLLQVCQRFHTAFELNEAVHRKLTERQAATYENGVALARDLGVKIAVSSDAHQLSEIGRFNWVKDVTDRIGLGEEDFYRHPSGIGL